MKELTPEEAQEVVEAFCEAHRIPPPDDVVFTKYPHVLCAGTPDVKGCYMHTNEAKEPHVIVLPERASEVTVLHELWHYYGHVKDGGLDWRHDEQLVEALARKSVGKYRLHRSQPCPACLSDLKKRLCELPNVPKRECEALLDDFWAGKKSVGEVVSAFRDRWRVRREEFERALLAGSR